MLRALANVSSVALACLAWTALAALILTAAGADPLGLGAAGGPPDQPRPNQLCALAAPLGQGFDRRCDFTAHLLPGADALRVTLDETWEATTLLQRLIVKAPEAAAPAFAVVTRSASSAGATRLSQLALIAATTRDDHLAFSVGNCGAVVCGQHDVVVLGAPDGIVREVLRVRLGRAGGFEVVAGGLITLEPFVPAGAAGAAGSVARTYSWDGHGYVLRGVAVRAPASPSTSPR